APYCRSWQASSPPLSSPPPLSRRAATPLRRRRPTRASLPARRRRATTPMPPPSQPAPRRRSRSRPRKARPRSSRPTRRAADRQPDPPLSLQGRGTGRRLVEGPLQFERSPPPHYVRSPSPRNRGENLRLTACVSPCREPRMLSINAITVRLGGRLILDRATAALPPGSRVG